MDSDIVQATYQPLPVGKTFWDEGLYENVAKRIENGKRSINDFRFMVKERAALEKNYAENLQNWYTKWNKAVKGGPEFGEVEAVWTSILKEGQMVADVHFAMSSKLGFSEREGLQGSVYQFKHNHYHTVPILKELKEAREAREAFKAIQSAYKRSTEVIAKLRKRYEDLSRNVQQLSTKIADRRSITTESSRAVRSDSVLRGKLEAMVELKDKAKAKYLASINHFNDNVRDAYVTEMNAEFQKAQEFELKRVTMLLNSLYDFVSTINLQTHVRQPLTSLYTEVSAPLTVVQPERNLIYFAKNFGPLMTPNFPKFEDVDMIKIPAAYSSSDPRVRSLRLGSAASVLPGIAKTLLKRKARLKSEADLSLHRSSARDFILRRPSQYSSGNHFLSHGIRDQPIMQRSCESLQSMVVQTKSTEASVAGMSVNPNEHYHMTDVYVRAVESFVGTNREHLGLSKGEVVYQLKGDVNGWCYGRIACKEGYYPSKAVNLLKMNLFS